VSTEGPMDGPCSASLGAIEDEQPTDLRIKPALDQVVDQRLHDNSIPGRPFDHAEPVFVAVGVDCEGGDQHQVVFDLQAVDLAHHQVQLGQVRRLSASHSARLRHKPARGRRFRGAPLARRDVIAQRPSQSSNSGRDTQARGVAYWGAFPFTSVTILSLHFPHFALIIC